jgi:hypothetical protein
MCANCRRAGEKLFFKKRSHTTVYEAAKELSQGILISASWKWISTFRAHMKLTRLNLSHASVVCSQAQLSPGAYYNNNNNNLNSNLVHMLNLDQNKRDGSKRNNNESNRGIYVRSLSLFYIVAIAFAALLCVMHGPGFIQSRVECARRELGFEIIMWSCSYALSPAAFAFWLDGEELGWDARQKLSCVSELKKTIWHSGRGEPTANVYFLFANCPRALLTGHDLVSVQNRWVSS